MGNFEIKYKVLLDGVLTTPHISDEFSYKWEKEEDSFYFRKKLDTAIKFVGTDYNAIIEATVGTKHVVVIQKHDGASWTTDYTGFFYKTDCDVNDNYKWLTVKTKPDDGWEDVKKLINNQYNLVELAPSATPVTYKLRPVIQIIVQYNLDGTIFGGDRITNIAGTANWEESLTESVSATDLKNIYGFSEEIIGVGAFYYRYLTTLSSIDGIPTLARPAEDISNVAPAYRYIVGGAVSKNGQIYTGVQEDPTKWGIINCKAIPAADGNYYQELTIPASNTIAIPVSPARWICGFSYWYSYSETLNQLELANSEETTADDCYKLYEVIQKLLSQETGIVHRETSDYSEFFYSDSNPITGDKLYPIISPKSNIRGAYYTDPARKANIRLSELLEMLASVYNVYWHIETVGLQKRFRLEHIVWYENGGTYSNQQITYDATRSYDKRTGKPFSYYQNAWKYAKQKMPQRIEFGWMDDVSDVFEGLPLRVLSPQVNDGQIDNRDAANYTSDIDMILGREEIALDGFALIDAELVSGDYKIRYSTIEVSEGNSFSIQNGKLSYTYLVPSYHRYGLPANDVEINGEETQALSILRAKQQEIEIADKDADIDPLKLITTEIGSGQVDEMSFNLISGKYEITLNHDTE